MGPRLQYFDDVSGVDVRIDTVGQRAVAVSASVWNPQSPPGRQITLSLKRGNSIVEAAVNKNDRRSSGS
jgi:hypothetical protein